MSPKCFVSKFAIGNLTMYWVIQEVKYYMYSRSVLPTVKHVLCMEKSIQQLNRKATDVEQYYNLNLPDNRVETPQNTGNQWKRHADCRTQRFQNIAVRKNSMCTAHFETKFTSWCGSTVYRLKSNTLGKDLSFWNWLQHPVPPPHWQPEMLPCWSLT